MPHMPKDHEPWATNDGKHVMVPNFNEMISTIATMTRANARVLEPLGADRAWILSMVRFSAKCDSHNHLC
jgi:hypothetical protein